MSYLPKKMKPRKKSRKRKSFRTFLMPRYARQRRLITILIGLSLIALIFVQCQRPNGSVDTTSEKRYFDTMAPYAQYYGEHAHIFPSLILAQSALESDFGRSALAAEYHNYFGIKELREGRGKAFPTLEVIDGETIQIEDKFRVYDHAGQSVRDYTQMIRSMDRYTAVWQADTPENAAYALVAGGYATDPNYAEKLIYMINTYHLKQYDQP